MTFKRLLMPLLVVGIFLTMGSMAFAQVVCGINSTGPAIPAANVNGVTGAGSAAAGDSQILALVGASANNTNTGLTEPIAAGPFEVPLDTTPAASNAPVPNAGTPANRIPGGGTLRVSCINTGAAITNPGAPVVVLTVSVGAPITNTTSFPSVATGVRVINGTGVFITAGATSGTPTNGVPNTTCTGAPGTAFCANVGISAVNNSSGSIVIGLGTPAAFGGIVPQNPNTGVAWGAGAVGTFDLSGVLVSTNGLSGSLTASLASSPGVTVGSVTAAQVGPNGAASGATTVATTAITQGIQDPTVATGVLTAPITANCTVGNGYTSSCAGGPAVLLSNGTATKNNFTLRIAENYPEMFKSAAQFNGGGVFPAGAGSGVQLNVVLGNVPAGLSVSGCNAVLTDTTGTVVRPGTPALVTPNNSVSNTLTVIFQTDTDLVDSDVLWVTCAVSLGGAALPLPSASITAQVELAPVGTALSSLGSANTSLTTGNTPRYGAKLQPATALTIVTFPPTQTTLLIPYAVVTTGFNTGIAIANTSTDVFGAAAGGATATAGTIAFTMYPAAGGTALTFTSSSVASGAEFVSNLSSMLPSGTTSFSGYIFAVANFPNAHGGATIYTTTDGAAALSSPVLVVAAAGGSITSANPRSSPESLGQ